VPKLTEENYPVCKQKIDRVLITKTAYNIVPGDELLPVGNSVALYLLQASCNGRDRAQVIWMLQN
jgi:hypothetical protein